MGYNKKQIIIGLLEFIFIVLMVFFIIYYFGIFLNILKWTTYILLSIFALIGIIWIFDKILNFFGWLGSWTR